MPPSPTDRQPPSLLMRGRVLRRRLLLTGWLCLTLLGAQALGWAHSVAHAGWASTDDVALVAPAGAGEPLRHDCLLLDACTLALALTTPPPAAPLLALDDVAAASSVGLALGQPPRLAFRSQAPPRR